MNAPLQPLALRLCLLIVRAVAWLVPRHERETWRNEWEAELRQRWARGCAAPSRAAELRLIRRTLGALVDATWLRRQFTLDADIVHDARHGVRMLAKAPGFTVVALVVFAIGIGATTAIASLADALFFRPLPLPDAERVVTLWERNLATGAGREDVAPGNAIDWTARARGFGPIAAIEPWSVDFSPGGGIEPEVFHAARVSSQFFEVLRIPMQYGRGFLAEDYAKGGSRVAVLAHALWRDRFGADPSVIGRTVLLDREPYVIVGVLPVGIDLRLFEQRREPQVFLTKQFESFEARIRGTGYWNVIGRLAPGVTIEQARANFDVLSTQIAGENPKTNQNTRGEIVPLRDHLAGSLRGVMPLLIAAAVLVLLVACANAANLILARGMSRTGEFAVRQALGAGRGRLLRQMLTETMLVTAMGGAAGLLLARASLAAISRLRPADVAGADTIGLDLRVAAVACGLSALTVLSAGLIPALQLSRPTTPSTLREGASRRGGYGVRGILVVIEVSLAVLLAVGAGLLVRSLTEIQRVDPGFSRGQITVLQVFAWDRQTTPEKRATFFKSVLDELRAEPGVKAVGAVTAMPFIEANIAIRSPISIVGQAPPAPGDDALIFTTVVAGDYFDAMGIPLDRGRLFDTRDGSASRPVAVITRSAARKYWPAADPIGAHATIRFAGKPSEVEIVGIVGDALHDALDRPARREMFLPHAQSPYGSMTFVVRAQESTQVSLQSLKQRVWAVDPLQAFYRTATMEELVARTLVGRRFNVLLLAGFGVIALLLAAAGLYGVMSFSTARRAREFGVRIALGAKASDILRLVVTEGVRLTTIGIAAGLVAAFWLTRLLRGLLFHVGQTDPGTFGAVALLLLTVALVSSAVPAWRAIRSDPLTSLKAE